MFIDVIMTETPALHRCFPLTNYWHHGWCSSFLTSNVECKRFGTASKSNLVAVLMKLAGEWTWYKVGTYVIGGETCWEEKHENIINWWRGAVVRCEFVGTLDVTCVRHNVTAQYKYDFSDNASKMKHFAPSRTRNFVSGIIKGIVITIFNHSAFCTNYQHL